ncbi:MAG TPA: 3-dehydroquinate synthase [Polyangia bacterium]|nr:3-dehydroquinate synthase [Polyangia bacterium]
MTNTVKPTTVGVELGARRYDVRIGTIEPAEAAAAIADALGAVTGVAVLVDAAVGARSPRVAPLVEALRARLPQVNVKRFDLRAGEACKTLAEIERTTEWLAEEGYDRRGAVVGVGGGAATDHAGFAAAVYLRGVRFALVPTTLLAMVDASVGGKTAVDLPAGKNLVGAFHQPSAVVADLGFLDTLPAREVRAGLAEVVKCAFIADAPLLTILETAPQGDGKLPIETAAELVARAVRVKAEVVAEDETEGGRRAILNFGHTVGHALEAASGYGLLHGEAVGLGMLAALSLGEARGLGTPALTARATALLARLGLPVDLRPRLSAEVLSRVAVDKKRRGGAIKFVFVPQVGETKLVDVSPDEIAAHFLQRGSGARA